MQQHARRTVARRGEPSATVAPMPRIARPNLALPPAKLDHGDEPRPPVPVDAMPTRLRAKARWVDQTFGNGNGTLSKRELAAYKRAYGSDSGHTRTIAALQRQLDLENPPARPERTVTVPAAPVTLSSEAAARRLVRPGGRGTQADVDAVVAELQKLPPLVLDRAHRAGVQVVACRESITDHLTQLRGVTPRGWPPGTTWDRVPGVYDPASMTVVMATHEGPRAERALPDFGYGHGSFNALFHEFCHALDSTNALGHDSRSAPFRAAYTADLPALRRQNLTYLLQPGDAGPEEAYAEMAARYFSRDPSLRGSAPHLHGFFAERARELGLPS